MKNILSVIVIMCISLVSQAQTEIGEKAPNFTLKNIDGKMVSLTDYKSQKGVIIVFTCNHCPYSKLYEDRIVSLNAKYEKEGFPVIAINSNNPKDYEEDSYENMIIRAKEKGFTFPYLVDDKGIYKKYGASKTPHVYLLEKKNNSFEVVYIGAIDDNARAPKEVKEKYIENAIQAIKKGDKVNPSVTKAIGCSIKPY
ncbi:thioredoxin family protein [Saccharicrinis aurantiacus]|uniref:thioredoxin family protein n=1 Tax=Saccharicrinis aurantiacus TaxID=1849719 RepID=UPI00094FDDE3|nr:thioredoxin family protein [Saccharicrinis aurantiacus]